MEDIAKLIVDYSGIWCFLMTLVGASITQLLSLKIGSIGATKFLKTWFPKKSDEWYARVNCVVLVVVGATLAYVILEPDTLKSGLCAGLTWCGTLQTLGMVSKD